MEWGAIIGGTLSLVILILRQWFKEKSKVEQAHDLASGAQKDIIAFRRKVENGEMQGSMEELDRVESRVRLLLRLRKKTNPPGK